MKDFHLCVLTTMTLIRFFALWIICSLTILAQADMQRLELAKTFEKSGDYREASRIYQELYAKNNNSQELFDGVVRTLSALNQFTAIVPIAEQRCKKNGDFQTCLLYTGMLYRVSKVAEANAALEGVRKTAAGNADAHAEIGQALASVRWFAEALNSYKTARTLYNSPSAFADEMSQLYVLLGDYTNGCQETLTLLRETKNLSFVQGRMSALINSPESRAYVRKVLEDAVAGSRDYMIHKVFVWFLREVKDYNGALNETAKIDVAFGLQGREVLEYAEIVLKDGQYESAAAAFSKVMDRGKGSPFFQNALYGYVRALDMKSANAATFSRDDILAIIDRYRSVIAQYPTDMKSAECQLRIGYLYLRSLSDQDQAFKEFDRVQKGFRNSPYVAEARNGMAEILLRADKLSEAEAVLEETIRQFGGYSPKDADKARFLVADIMLIQGRADSAKERYAEIATRLDGDEANNALERITLLEQNKDNPSVLSDYIAAWKYDRQFKSIEAVRAYDSLAARHQDTELAETSLLRAAELLAQNGDLIGAQVRLEVFGRVYPESANADRAMLFSAQLAERQNDAPRAIEILTSMLARFPKSILLKQAREKIRRLRGDT